MAKYKQLGTTKKIHSKKSRRKGGPGRGKKFVKKLRYVYSDRAEKPARRCQLNCLLKRKIVICHIEKKTINIIHKTFKTHIFLYSFELVYCL